MHSVLLHIRFQTQDGGSCTLSEWLDDNGQLDVPLDIKIENNQTADFHGMSVSFSMGGRGAWGQAKLTDISRDSDAVNYYYLSEADRLVQYM